MQKMKRVKVAPKSGLRLPLVYTERMATRAKVKARADRALRRLMPKPQRPVPDIAFSVVHEAWTIPPIFFLSLCLGYAYERTGNLWTVMFMHAAFNTTSTLIYLLFAS